MPLTRLEEYSDEPLSPIEIQKARRMLEADERAHWLWNWMRNLIIALTGVAAFIAAIKVYVYQLAGWLVGK